MVRYFLEKDEGWLPLASEDIPFVPVTSGGTGLNYLGPTNHIPVVGGPSGLFWRLLTPDNIHPSAKDGVGDNFIIAHIASLANGDIVVWDAANNYWKNSTPSAAMAHALLDGAMDSDTLASAPVRGGIIVANSTPLWAQLALGSAGKILRSDGTDLKYSTTTYPDTVASGNLIVATGTNQIGQLALSATDKTILQSYSTGAAWSSATYPDSTTANRILYSSATNTVGEITTAASGVLVTSAGGVPSISTTLPAGLTIPGYAASGSNSDITALTGITGGISNVSTLTFKTGATSSIRTGVTAGDVIIFGAYDVDGAAYTEFARLTANNTPTFNLQTSATIGGNAFYYASGTDVTLLDGGTNASLTASNGGIVYSTASAMAILAGTATARQMLQSGASTTPAWSTTTWPATTTINRILYSSAASVIGEITTANSGVLVTDSGGIPSIATDIPTAVTIGTAYVYRVGGTDVAIADGGTGQSTATLGFNALSPVTTRGDIIVRDATNNVRLALGSAGKVLRSDGTDLNYSAVTYTDSPTSGGIPYYSSTTAVSSSALLTNHALIVGGGAGATPATIAALTDGQLPIGSTGANPVPATLTGGDDVSITNAAGSITIGRTTNADTGAFVMIPYAWPDVASSTTIPGANACLAWRFYLPFKHTFSTAVVRVTTFAGGSTGGVGVYSADGNTKYFHGTGATTVANVVTMSLSSDTSLTLSPGFYLVVLTDTSASVAFAAAAIIDTNFDSIYEQTTVNFGTTANSSSSGVVPTTTGALTTTSKKPPFIKLY